MARTYPEPNSNVARCRAREHDPLSGHLFRGLHFSSGASAGERARSHRTRRPCLAESWNCAQDSGVGCAMRAGRDVGAGAGAGISGGARSTSTPLFFFHRPTFLQPSPFRAASIGGLVQTDISSCWCHRQVAHPRPAINGCAKSAIRSVIGVPSPSQAFSLPPLGTHPCKQARVFDAAQRTELAAWRPARPRRGRPQGAVGERNERM